MGLNVRRDPGVHVSIWEVLVLAIGTGRSTGCVVPVVWWSYGINCKVLWYPPLQ